MAANGDDVDNEGAGANQPLLQRRASVGSAATTTASEAAAGWGAGQRPAAASADGPHRRRSWRRTLELVAVPTGFDLVATVLMSVGLLAITASAYQMMKGSEVVFSALLARCWLGRRLNRWHLAGIALCLVGISVVGSASLLDDSSSSSSSSASLALRGTADPAPAPTTPSAALLGMLLVVAAEAVQSAQVRQASRCGGAAAVTASTVELLPLATVAAAGRGRGLVHVGSEAGAADGGGVSARCLGGRCVL